MQVDTNNLAAIEVLETIIFSGKYEYACLAADILIENNPCHHQAINKLEQIITSVEEEKIICLAANGLMKSKIGKLEATTHLKETINSTIHPFVSREAIDILIRLIPKDKFGEMVTFGKNYSSTKKHTNSFNDFVMYEKSHMYEQICQHMRKLIWHCAQNMTYSEFYQAWHK
ncbi:MAG: hypothetical protein KI793_21930 [Rivularia sp. (in: Bacteria)]|nr:hypothetical protein [Rivularia sp. MS3]